MNANKRETINHMVYELRNELEQCDDLDQVAAWLFRRRSGVRVNNWLSALAHSAAHTDTEGDDQPQPATTI